MTYVAAMPCPDAPTTRRPVALIAILAVLALVAALPAVPDGCTGPAPGDVAAILPPPAPGAT